MAVSDRERVAAAEPGVRPRTSLRRAALVLRLFLDRIAPTARHVLLCHSDADGLAAAVVLRCALERAGRHDLVLTPTGKGETAWSAGTLRRLGSARPEALFVLDLGSRPQPIFPGIPTLLIDHHRPLGMPPGARLISSYRWRLDYCAAALAYWSGMSLADISDLDWVAALGIIGDLGEEANLAPLPGAQERYGRKKLREATALVNAARRSAEGDARLAVAALRAAREPADIAHGHLPEAYTLAEERQAFRVALNEAKRAAPVFRDHLALIRVRSPYLVHPVLAQMWRQRLPGYIVMVANEGYLPDRVNFSVRTSLDANLLDFLQAFREGLDATELGHGHDRATGGSLRVEDWKRLLATIGFHLNQK